MDAIQQEFYSLKGEYKRLGFLLETAENLQNLDLFNYYYARRERVKNAFKEKFPKDNIKD